MKLLLLGRMEKDMSGHGYGLVSGGWFEPDSSSSITVLQVLRTWQLLFM